MSPERPCEAECICIEGYNFVKRKTGASHLQHDLELGVKLEEAAAARKLIWGMSTRSKYQNAPISPEKICHVPHVP